MHTDDFSGAALVVLGHGTGLNPHSAEPARRLADGLRQRGGFRAVREAYWKQAPQIRDVMVELGPGRTFIVPLFISEGYFACEIIPAELGFGRPPARLTRTDGERFYCLPVGTHERMTEVVQARAAEIVRQFPFPRAPRPAEVSLFIAGHGTGRNADSRKAVEWQADRLRERGEFASVTAVFMEEEPRIADCYALAPARHVVVVPYFISDGLHAVEDIPVLLGELPEAVRERLAAGVPTWRNPTERHGKLVWYASAVGTAPQLMEVILDRVRETARWFAASS